MALSIGQNALTAYRSQSGQNMRLNRADTAATARSADSGSKDTSPFFQQSRLAQPARVGFGEGTVSAPTAAFQALGRGMESARQIVPTLQELTEDARSRVAEQRDTEMEPRESVQVGIAAGQQEAVSNARSLINTVSDQLGTTQRRLAGEDEPASNAAIRIQGERFDVSIGPNTAAIVRQPQFNVQI